jgi:hypothetical protein
MKIAVDVPQILEIEGVGRNAHVRLRGTEASVAIAACDLITTQRLLGTQFAMLEGIWLITAASISSAGVSFTCRRLKDV